MGRAKKNVEVEAQVIARGNVVPMMTEAESAETVQYVSDEDAAREDRLVSEIRMITEQTKQVVLFNSIEIGRRLTEAKAMVKRGTWGTWLKEIAHDDGLHVEFCRCDILRFELFPDILLDPSDAGVLDDLRVGSLMGASEIAEVFSV